MIIKIIFLLIALFFLPFFCFAQNIDSLKYELKKAKHDTIRCKILNELTENASDEEWPEFNNQLLKITSKKIKLEKLSKAEYILYKKYHATAVLNLGVLANSFGELDTALLHYNNSLGFFLNLKDTENIALCYNNIGALYDNIDNNELALNYLTKSLNLYEKCNNKSGIATALNNIGIHYNKLGETDRSIYIYKKCLKINEEINDKDGIALILNNLAFIYSKQGNLSIAIKYLKKSLGIAKLINQKDRIATALLNLGEAKMNLGLIKESLDDYSKCLQIYEEIKNKDGIATTLNNIGFLYSSQNENDKAIEYFQKSLAINKEISSKSSIANCLNNLGTSYENKNEFDKAINNYNQSLKIFEEIDNKQGIGMVLYNIALIYDNKKEWDKALELYEKSLISLKIINYNKGISFVFNNIGEIYLIKNKTSIALQYALESMKISKELGYPENIKRVALLLNKIYKKQGNYNNALINYELYIQMRDSINNIETQKATIKQQSKYEFDKQQALEQEKHDAELLIQKEKSSADKKRQQMIIFSVSLVLFLVGIFSFMLFKRFKTTQKQKIIIEKKEKETQEQKHLVEEKQKEILDSIHYAKRLQEAILPPLHFINEHVPNNFVLYQPKDVVAGDFYWAEIKDDKFFIAAADSTGHGVPGAMVSVVCSNALNRTVNEFGITDTGKILDKTRELVLETFAKGNSEVKDGMDISLLCIDKSNNKVYWSGANNPLWYVKSSVTSSAVEKSTDTGLDSARPDIQLIEIKADKQPIGKSEITKPFTAHEIALQDGMQFYLFTDGFADQFGGPKGKKFMYKQLENLLISISHESMEIQKQKLEDVFKNWKGDLEQVDDVCVIGVKI